MPTENERDADVTIGELKRKVSAIETKLRRLDELQIPIEVLPDGMEPYHANDTDAGYDLFATETVFLPPGRSHIMPVGIKVAVPEGYEIQIRPRSGISSKVALRIANSPGTVDAGYRDEIGVILYNEGSPTATGMNSPTGHFPVGIDGSRYSFTGLDPVTEGELPADTIVIQRGDRIAQMVIAKVVRAAFVRVDDVRGIEGGRNGGFGSTGVFSMPLDRWDGGNGVPAPPETPQGRGPLGFLFNRA